jgi:hypothetical protein
LRDEALRGGRKGWVAPNRESAFEHLSGSSSVPDVRFATEVEFEGWEAS